MTNRKTTLVVSVAAAAVVAAGAAWAVAPMLPNSPLLPHAADAPIAAQPAAWAGGESIADIVQKVEPSVVTITVDEAPQQVSMRGNPFGNSPMGEFFRQFMGPQVQQGQTEHTEALGSGFLIDSKGDILTNNHVVDGGTRFTVEFSDKTIAEAKLVGTDPATDLAVIHVDKTPATAPLTFANSSKIRVGDPVIAIGDPYGVGETVTSGVISARGRSLGTSSYVDYIQTDAPINEGNSGGPLLDYSGQVVGINSAIFSPSGGNVGIGFAIPSNTAIQVVNDILRDGKVTRAWLGAAVQDVTPQIAAAAGLTKAEGAIIAQVDPNGPSAGKLKTGDIVTGFDGQTIHQARDLSMDASQAKIGSNARLTVIRQGRQQDISVKMARLPSQENAQTQVSGNRGSETAPKLGVTVSPLDGEARQQLGLANNTQGALITDIDPNGAAAHAGISAGDVIEQVGNTPVTNGRSLASALGKTQNDTALLLIDRGGQRHFLAVPLG